MLTIAADFKRSMDRVISYLDLSVATFDLAKVNVSRFRSSHALAAAARDVHAKARALPLGLVLACEGAYLSACAQFEQSVRDIIDEAAIQAIARKVTFTSLPIKMQDNHISGCGIILQNIKQDRFQHLTPSGIAAALHGCFRTSATPVVLVVEAFSSNDKNFKPKVVSEHLGRLGLTQVWNLLGQQACVQAHFATTSAADAEKFARERLERIMDKRNAIIHRAKGFVAPSDTEARECAAFFTSLIEGVAHVLIAYISNI